MARSTARAGRRSSRPGSSTSFTGSYDMTGRALRGHPASTRTRRRGASRTLLVPHHRGVYLVERLPMDLLAAELDVEPGQLRMKNSSSRAVPLHVRDGLEYDSGDYATTLRLALGHAGYDALRKEQAEKRGARRADGHRDQLLHRGVAPAPASTWTSWNFGMADRCRAARASNREGRAADLGATRARATRRRSRRSSRRSWASRPTTSRWCTATPTRRVRARHVRLALDPGLRRRDRRRDAGRYGSARGWSPGPCSRPTPPLEWRARDAGSYAATRLRRDDPGDRHGRARQRGTARQGVEATSNATTVYKPPNLTYPSAPYICVVDVDPAPARVSGGFRRGGRLRRPHQPDDRGRPR